MKKDKLLTKQKMLKIIYPIFGIGLAILLLFIVFNEAFNKLSIGIIILGYFIYLIGVLKNDLKVSFIGYLIILIAILFIRPRVTNSYTDSRYIKEWISILFTNKIVFMNVIGNIFLYIPFVIYMIKITNKYFYSFIISILVIISFELFQLLLKVGVFDYIDIVLNTFGVFITSVICEVNKCLKRKKIKN